ncbi:MAG: Bug family tripartite tricarboxylate transporter substrate binding protein, partial [Beijerinckiaceae bacterium]
ERTVSIIVPFTAGSGPDILARLAADELRNRWGQAVMVDNRPGASGTLGAAAVNRAAPDGHTLMLWVNTLLMNAAMARNLTFDAVKGFSPIIDMADGVLALAVHSSVEAKDAQALIAATKAKPEAIRYASPGRGTPHHFAMELFKLRTEAKMDHVPYTGTAGAVNDFVAGHVQAMFIPIHVGLSHARAGRIRLLAVSSPKRTPLAPDVPTLAEQGVREAEVNLGYGLSAPPGTPPEIIQRFNAVMNEALRDERVVKLLEGQGLSPVGGTPDAFVKRIDDEAPRWVAVVRAAGISADN